MPRIVTSFGGHEYTRSYADARGIVWTVHEIAPGSERWAKASYCLVFVCESAVRRVWRYPANWQALSSAELETLSWTT